MTPQLPPVALSNPRDPGLQAERTALSWSRTAIAVLVNAMLALRTGWVNQHKGLEILGLVLLICAAATFNYGLKRRHALREDSTAPRLPIGAIYAVTGLTLGASITAIAVIAL